jgi:DNA-binding CsgD family transcriptional regulator
VSGGWELSPRQRQVAALVTAGGLTRRQAAARLRITGATVDTHMRHVYNKLGISTRAELLDWARRKAATRTGKR